MINKKLFLFLMLSIFLVSIISAQDVLYCCEETLDLDPITAGYQGGKCINDHQEKCDTSGDLRAVPTSCKATSYCRLGVCINNKEGTCMPNTPQIVCEENEGVWDEKDKADIPQCQLGCCLIGEQAAFVTLTRCKSLASKYGLEINYRTDIQSETECIANARPKVKGACVYEQEYQRTCKFTTKKECQEMEMVGEEASVEFYENYLCSATELTTNCAATTKTTCVEGKDEVYFLDSCGNLANVYDAEKRNTPSYWEETIAPDCSDGEGNKDSTTCGDCDYFLGSTCKKAERLNKPEYGDFICKDLSCKYERKAYQHGETWCVRIVDDKGTISLGKNPGIEGKNLSIEDLEKEINRPGSRDFRLVCYNNEVSVEPCAEFRQEVCHQSEVNEFKTAACRVNMWQDCYSQDNQLDCENPDKRDCKWIEGVSILRDSEGNNLVTDLDEDGEPIEASCVPEYAPGFDFWEEGTEATSMCSLANTQCFVEYQTAIWEGALEGKRGDVSGDWKCIEKCRAECLIDDPFGLCKAGCKGECPSPCANKDGTINETWRDNMNAICMAMGDCGSSYNYIEKEGYYKEEDIEKDSITRSSEEGEEE